MPSTTDAAGCAPSALLPGTLGLGVAAAALASFTGPCFTSQAPSRDVRQLGGPLSGTRLASVAVAASRAPGSAAGVTPVAVVSCLAAAGVVLAAPRRVRRNGRSARVVACAAEEEAKTEVAEEPKAEAEAEAEEGKEADAAAEDEAADEEEAAEEEPKAEEKKKPAKWACSACGSNNFAQARECNKCGAPKPSRAEAEKIAEKVAAKDGVAEVMDDFLRLQADLQNYRRKHNESMSRAKDLGVEDALRKLVPYTNDIDAALVAPEGMTEKEAKYFQSYSILFSKVRGVWEKFGVVPQEVNAGDAFDQDLHKKVEERKAEGDEQPGSILKVVTPGWKMGSKVLIPAAVSIVASAEEEEEAAEEEAAEGEPAEEEVEEKAAADEEKEKKED